MCWNRHMVYGSWPREARRPDVVSRSHERVSDADRDDVVQQLSRHTGDGRLSLDEFEQRVGEAFAAKTRGELDATLSGLPRPATRVPRRVDVADRLRPLVLIGLIVLAVVAMGPWVLWVAVPLMWCRLGGRRRARWHEVEPATPDRDDLTLV